MEIVFIIFAGFVIALWLLVTIVTTTFHDIRLIHLDKQLRRHPHARRWRQKPVVSIVYESELSEASRLSILQSSYRKRKIIQDPSLAPDGLVLFMRGSDVLQRTAIRDAVVQFQYRQSTGFVEIIPRVTFPRTVRQFFAVYHDLALAPFIKLRSALGVAPTMSRWPIAVRTESVKRFRGIIYGTVRWVVQLTNLAVLLYVGYIGFALQQPDYLLAYGMAFGLWMVWAIGGHQQLSFRQKLAYFALLPASLGFFVWRCLVAPFSLLRLLLFVRSSRQMV